MKLDPEEREILEAYERGEINPQKPSKELLSKLSKAAENTFKKVHDNSVMGNKNEGRKV